MVEATAGRVTARTSNDGHFTIFNYTQETSVTKNWNDVNRWCRGLIFDEVTHEVVAVPFYKFFTLGQMSEVTYEALVSYGTPTRIANKEDGSLGIMFWDKYKQCLRVSTRGSLDSEQAIWATNWINGDGTGIDSLDRFVISEREVELGQSGWTYQFEVVYKANRIVVDYAEFEGLVGLARVNNATGKVDYDLGALPSSWRIAESFDGLSLEQIMQLKDVLTWNTEGWVLTYDSGLMVKIKVEEYKKVHAIRFAVTPNTILKLVQDGQDPLLAVVDLPDEFVDEIKETMVKIEARYQQLLTEFRTSCADGLSMISSRTRKENALWCLENVPEQFRSAFFHVVSGKGDEPRDILINKVSFYDIV
jgi:RNA ligase